MDLSVNLPILMFSICGLIWKYWPLKQAIDGCRMPFHRLKRFKAIQLKQRRQQLLIDFWSYFVWLLLAISAIGSNTYFYLPWQITQILSSAFHFRNIFRRLYQRKMLEIIAELMELVCVLAALFMGDALWNIVDEGALVTSI